MRRLAGLHLCCRSHRSREPSAWETIRASPHLAQVDWIRPRWSSRRKTKPRTKGEGWRSLIAEAFVRRTLLCPAGRALWRAWRQMACDTEHYKPVRLANIPPSDTFAASQAAFFWSRPLMDEPPLWRVVGSAGRGVGGRGCLCCNWPQVSPWVGAGMRAELTWDSPRVTGRTKNVCKEPGSSLMELSARQRRGCRGSRCCQSWSRS
jgi:hypothetical protein